MPWLMKPVQHEDQLATLDSSSDHEELVSVRVDVVHGPVLPGEEGTVVKQNRPGMHGQTGRLLNVRRHDPLLAPIEELSTARRPPWLTAAARGDLYRQARFRKGANIHLVAA